MRYTIVLTGDRMIHFTDERDLDQLAEAIARQGYLKIAGEHETSGRASTAPTIVFREHVIHLEGRVSG